MVNLHRILLPALVALVAACDDVDPVAVEPLSAVDAPVIVYHPPPRREPDTVPGAEPTEPVIYDVLVELPGAEDWLLGSSRLEDGPGGWRASYDLFSGAGCVNVIDDGGELFCLADDTYGGFRTYHARRRAPSDGPNPAQWAALVSRWDLRSGRSYRLPAHDLRQGLDYDLVLHVGQAAELTTTWERLPARPVEVSPQGLTLWLDEAGRLVELVSPEARAVRRPADNLPETP